jgi:hypothetical protein
MHATAQMPKAVEDWPNTTSCQAKLDEGCRQVCFVLWWMVRTTEPKTVENWSSTAPCPVEIGPAGVIWPMKDGPYTVVPALMDHTAGPGRGYTQLRASGNSSCFCCWYITNRILLTVVTEITHPRLSRFSSRPMSCPCATASGCTKERWCTQRQNFKRQ